MKKLLTLFVLLSAFLGSGDSQTLVQSNFNGVLVPQYIASGGNTRLPYVFRATLTGLIPNAKYRYYTQAVRYTDFGGTNSGAGNPLLINGTNFRYTTSTSLSNPAGYDSLMTDASGNYTGWFGFVNSGNVRFTAGNYIYPSITLDSAGNGSTKHRFALSDSMYVLQFSDSANVRSGTGIYGVSLALPKNIISLYDNVNNTGRPVAMTYVESEGIDTVAMASLVQYYKDSVEARNGRWGTIVPNMFPSGVRRINVHNLSNGTVANFQADADGVWPSGTNTVNPNGGAALPLRLTQTDVPLIVRNENISPDNFSLKQNYPNPFNPSTTINFLIPSSGNVTMKVSDMLGREVKTLVNGDYAKGSYNVNFNAESLNSGVYFYTINFDSKDGSNFTDTKKLILLK